MTDAPAEAHLDFRTGVELRPGARIVNARDAPGSLGCLAYTRHDQRLVLLTTHHLLFDTTGREDEPVWLPTESSYETPYQRIGQSLYGRSRIVRLDGDEYYVDCAVGSVTAALSPATVEHDFARPGERVTKTGACNRPMNARSSTCALKSPWKLLPTEPCG
jgi:hypothetical protein